MGNWCCTDGSEAAVSDGFGGEEQVVVGRLVLLGGTDAGKTTLLRMAQLGLNHFDSAAARKIHAGYIRNCVAAQLQEMCSQFLLLSIRVPGSVDEALTERLQALQDELGSAVGIQKPGVEQASELLHDEQVQRLGKEHAQSLSYLSKLPDILEQARRAVEPGFVPTNADILNIQWPTTGTSSMVLNIPNVGAGIAVE
eukprot:TRINITY_DN66582_c9_g1_i3.p1 TRINITY_DN66582_c9_g1~~TRINITY_DN66582_c9_g1_i3.p1  ORF type:complete len:197 (-),score=82.32 TRINITY_DN66582_c9_g1_i3:41-631(-)